MFIPDRIYKDQTLSCILYFNNILETRSRCSICLIFVFHIFQRQEIEAFSKVNFTNLSALMKSGLLVFENGVFLLTNAHVWPTDEWLFSQRIVIIGSDNEYFDGVYLTD